MKIFFKIKEYYCLSLPLVYCYVFYIKFYFPKKKDEN